MSDRPGFIGFLMNAEVTDDPRGHYIEDAQGLIACGLFYREPSSLDALLGEMRLRHADPELMREACRVWAEYERERGGASEHPKLLAFPVTADTCKVWCPFCEQWHLHGWDEVETRVWTHRVAHCRPGTATYERGYLIKIANIDDMVAIGEGAALKRRNEQRDRG